MRRTHEDYVCPYCFRRVEECVCKLPPWSLIMIDGGIQEHIRLLNEKEYITNGCCEGHYKSHCTEPYVSFVKEYDFEAIPDGFTYNRKRKMIVGHKIKGDTLEIYEANKNILLENLKKWVENL